MPDYNVEIPSEGTINPLDDCNLSTRAVRQLSRGGRVGKDATCGQGLQHGLESSVLIAERRATDRSKSIVLSRSLAASRSVRSPGVDDMDSTEGVCLAAPLFAGGHFHLRPHFDRPTWRLFIGSASLITARLRFGEFAGSDENVWNRAERFPVVAIVTVNGIIRS